LDVALLQGFYLGDLLVEPLTGRVVGPGTTGRLPPKAMEVLLCLASAPGELVLHETLLAKVWGSGHGSPAALAHAVRDIRHALADEDDQRRFIQTVPRRGYRLIQLPRPVSAGADPDARAVATSPESQGAAGPLEELLDLVQDLKSRGVIKTGFYYILVGGAIAGLADFFFESMGLPSWIATFVAYLVFAGFPIVIALSWFLEFRDGRVVLDSWTPAELRRRRSVRTFLPIVASLLIAAVGVWVYDRFVGLPKAAESPVASDAGRYLPSVLDSSIAVLRFKNLDGSEQTQVFSDGLADDVITALSRVPGLFVSSRGDSFTLEPDTASARVRERLRVAYYLEGSVQIEQETMRVIVQLIDSATGFHVLSRSFDRPVEGFFAMRDEITELTVANVRVALPQDQPALPVAEREAADLDAYVAYRHGREVLEKPRSLESIGEAIARYRQALAIDPQYAAAHAGICEAHVARFELSNSADDIDAAEQACASALEASPRLHMVYTSLGDLYRRTGRPDEAERAYRSALDMNPNDARAMVGLSSVFALRRQHVPAEQWLQKAVATQPGNWRTINGYGSYLFTLGRYEDAADAFRQVLALDTANHQARTNLGAALTMAGDFEAGKQVYEEALETAEFRTAYSNLGVMYYYLGDFEKSVATHRKAVELAPTEAVKWINLADALHFAGQPEEANEAFRRASELAEARVAVDPNDAATIFIYAWASQMLGDRPATERAIRRGLEIAPDDPNGLYLAGLIEARNGDVEAALESLRAAIDNGYPPRMLAAEPYLDELRANPAFQAMVSPSP